MGDIEVKRYQILYPSLNIEFKESDINNFKLHLILVFIKELGKGFKAIKIYKTDKKGTKVRYECMKTEEELKEYINEMIKFIRNERYGNLTIEDILK